MSTGSTCYLIAPESTSEFASARRRLPPEAVFDSVEAFLPLDRHSPGVVLLPVHGLDPADFVRALHACAVAGGAWAPVLLEGSGQGTDDPSGIPLLPAFRYPLSTLIDLPETGASGVALTLRDVTDPVRKVRHDINNPLAAALAEAQLLLMDVTEPETRRALVTIQDQLRRIRDLLIALRLPGPVDRG